MADIVVIEDHPDIRDLFCTFLRRAGHTVRAASDGREGVRLARERLPDIVVTDLFMPEQDGIETLIELKQTYPELRVLVVSGSVYVDDEGALADAALLGADATLPKPVSRTQLLSAVDELLA